MSAIVDYAYYTGTYMGTEADQASFPALNAHASRVIGAMTRWQVSEDNIGELPPLVQTLYKLAICSQVDFLSVNGIESLSAGNGVGFTVGKVRVDGSSRAAASGAMSASVSPAAVAYLEQTGLLNPAVPVWGCVC
nr:hypothetical protein [Oscillospiraceae bacterium]